MVDYVKQWKVGNRTLGIEDQEGPGVHFFPSDYQKGKRKRFSVWIGGCGTGEFDTLEKALSRAEEIRVREASNLRTQADRLILSAVEWDGLVIE